MKFDQGVDLAGPVPLAVVATGNTNNSRLVVFGDSDFATNAYYGFYGNGEMIMNSIDWAAKEENLISLTPKTSVQRTLVQPKPYTNGTDLIGLADHLARHRIGWWSRDVGGPSGDKGNHLWYDEQPGSCFWFLVCWYYLPGYFNATKPIKTEHTATATPIATAVKLYDLTDSQVVEINITSSSGEID